VSLPRAEVLEITERYAGAVRPLPVQLPIYRMPAVEEGNGPPKLDGKAEDWPTEGLGRTYGEMKVDLRYLSRADLLAGTLRGANVAAAPGGTGEGAANRSATVRWSYDKDYLYLLAQCPQDVLSDERSSQWPVRAVGEGVGLNGGARWWGSDGLQVVLGAMPPTNRPTNLSAAAAAWADATASRVVKVAFKPAGVVLVRTGQVVRDAHSGVPGVVWRDGEPPGGPNVKHSVVLEKRDGRVTGYTVEAAIPRAWVDGPNAAVVEGTHGPAWRVNVLWHRGADLTSTSWAGPLVDDDDMAMMGALLGE
jgi:hypothetical protein